jgi:hypothetical protein
MANARTSFAAGVQLCAWGTFSSYIEAVFVGDWMPALPLCAVPSNSAH